MSGVPYIGSKISLISNNEIRYEGVLVAVNPEDSTITFEQVRFFGTEGRRPGDEIAPIDRIFDCVVFRSSDIKDLQIYENEPVAAAKKQPENVIPDPAVVSFTERPRTGGFQYSSTAAASDATSSVVNMPRVNDYASAAASAAAPERRSFTTKTRGSQPPHHYNSHGHHSHHSSRPGAAKVVVPDSEFDFSRSNAKFSKDEDVQLTPSGSQDNAAPAYNKYNSFFDDISCQAKESSEDRTERFRNERNLNMETFGQASPYYHRRGGRGRGRGGYYRGGGNRNHQSN